MQEAIEQAKSRSDLGDKFREMQANGALVLLEANIFKKIEKEAFDLYKSTDPSDMPAVAQAQLMGKIVDNIRSRIEIIIQEGNKAKDDIKNFNKESENE